MADVRAKLHLLRFMIEDGHEMEGPLAAYLVSAAIADLQATRPRQPAPADAARYDRVGIIPSPRFETEMSERP